MSWKGPQLARSPFKSPLPPAPGEGEWTLLEDKGPPPFPRARSLSSEGLRHRSASPRAAPIHEYSASYGQLGSHRSCGAPRRPEPPRDTAWAAEAAVHRQYKQKLDEAEQQVAYWQARAKETEQSMLKYKTECVSLRCQLNAQQCTLSSLDELLASIRARLEGVGARVGVPRLPEEPMGGLRRFEEEQRQLLLEGAEGGGLARPDTLRHIEHVLRELEGRFAGGEGVGAEREACISFKSFVPGCIALFFPTPSGDFLAFNVGCPHHYLGEESKALVGQAQHFKPFYVLGRIGALRRCQVPPREAAGSLQPASSSSSSSSTSGGGARGGSAASHYNLPEGSVYFVAHVEPIADDASRGSATSSTSTASASRGAPFEPVR